MHSAYGLFLMAGAFKGLLKRISPPSPRGKFPRFWDKSSPKVSQEINDPLFGTLRISSLQVSSPNGTLADKNSIGDLSQCNCHLVQDFIWKQEKDLTSFSWPLTAGGDVLYSFPSLIFMALGKVEVGECGKMHTVSPNRCRGCVIAKNWKWQQCFGNSLVRRQRPAAFTSVGPQSAHLTSRFVSWNPNLVRLSAPDVSYCSAMPNGLDEGSSGESTVRWRHCCHPLNTSETPNASYFAGYCGEV